MVAWIALNAQDCTINLLDFLLPLFLLFIPSSSLEYSYKKRVDGNDGSYSVYNSPQFSRDHTLSRVYHGLRSDSQGRVWDMSEQPSEYGSSSFCMDPPCCRTSLEALGLCVNFRVHFPELPYAVMFPRSAVATALLERRYENVLEFGIYSPIMLGMYYK